MKEEWFEKWFDSNYYHLLYHSRNASEASEFIDQLVEFLNITPKCQVIDIACGRGRHSIHLNQKGLNVTGIDIAHHSIEHAKQYECSGLHFYQHDKKKVFKKNHFDFAFNLFTSFGYLESKDELKNVLLNMTLNLKPKGLFIIDFMNSAKIKKSKLESESLLVDGVEFKTNKRLENNMIIKEIEVKKEGFTKNYIEKVQLLELTDFIDFCNYSGLKILHTFGNYQLEMFDENNSDRLILIAERNT